MISEFNVLHPTSKGQTERLRLTLSNKSSSERYTQFLVKLTRYEGPLILKTTKDIHHTSYRRSVKPSFSLVCILG